MLTDKQYRNQAASMVASDHYDPADLLADLLKAYDERDAFRALVEKLAEMALVYGSNVPSNRRCMVCGVFGKEPLEHEPDCIGAQARKLLIGGE